MRKMRRLTAAERDAELRAIRLDLEKLQARLVPGRKRHRRPAMRA
jgi:hypothetical protein